MVVAPFFPGYRVWIENAGGVMRRGSAQAFFQLDIDAVAPRGHPADGGAHHRLSEQTPRGVVSREDPRRARRLERSNEGREQPISPHLRRAVSEVVYGVEVPWVPQVYHTVVCYSYSKSLSLPGERIRPVGARSQRMPLASRVMPAIAPARCRDSCARRRCSSAWCRLRGRAVRMSRRTRVNRAALTRALDEYSYTYVEPDGAFTCGYARWEEMRRSSASRARIRALPVPSKQLRRGAGCAWGLRELRDDLRSLPAWKGDGRSAIERRRQPGRPLSVAAAPRPRRRLHR